MDMTKEEEAARVREARRTGVNLQASRERKTGRGVFPRVPSASPSADRYEPITLPGEAMLYSFTVIHPNPKTSLKPVTLIYADFAEDTRVFGRLELPEGQKPVIGMALRVVSNDGDENPDTTYFFEPGGGGK